MINIPTNLYKEDIDDLYVYTITRQSNLEKIVCRRCLGSGSIISIINENLTEIPCTNCSGTGIIEKRTLTKWIPIKTPGKVVEVSSGMNYDNGRTGTIFTIEYPVGSYKEEHFTLDFYGENVFLTLDMAISECNKRNNNV